MTSPLIAYAEKLEHFADRVLKIRPLDRHGPHAFVEDKSDLIREILAEAKRLRAEAAPVPVRNSVATISPGARSIGRREIVVVRRSRRV